MRQVVLASAIALCACSTVVKGTDQNLAVITPYAEGAECALEDGKGAKYFVKSTPDNVVVNRGDGPLTVSCEKPGFKQATVIVDESFEPWTLGNILIGGVIGVGVDAASGALEQYPDEIKVYLEPVVWGSEQERQKWLEEKTAYGAGLVSVSSTE